MTNIRLSIVFASLLVLSACASAPTETFYPIGPQVNWHLPPKAGPSDVQVLPTLPVSGFSIMGRLAMAGGPKNSFQEMIDIAQREAATKGADFVILEKQQVQTHQETTPGFASVQSTGSATVNVSKTSGYGSANTQGTGFAVGPSVRNVQTGSMVFLFGTYPKVWLGLIMEPNRSDRKVVIADFAWDSPAPKAALRVGDELLAVGGRDIRDPEASKDLYFTAKAGDKVSVVAKRGEDRLELFVPYVDRFPRKP